MDLHLTEKEAGQVLAIKRDLHMHPELSHEEFRTTERIREVLSGLPGIEILDLPDTSVVKTGVVARLRGGKSGGETGLRADIDALPQTEQVESPYKSRCEGKMHACGHDFHTASLLGAAMILSRNRAEVPGTVDFLFQEAEETTNGCQEMIDAGLFSIISPKYFFGMHNRPEVPAGQVVIQSGGLMSAKSNFVITVHGKGGHGAMPHLCIDPIVCAAAIIQSLQTIVSRNVDPMENAILTIGSIHGGSVENLIVEDVRMTGCVRALSQKTKEMQIRRLEEIVTNTAKAYQCTADIEYKEVLPVAYNTPEMTKIAHRAAAADPRQRGLRDHHGQDPVLPLLGGFGNSGRAAACLAQSEIPCQRHSPSGCGGGIRQLGCNGKPAVRSQEACKHDGRLTGARKASSCAVNRTASI